mmetsp:Transcript_45274/g.92416  ORF Transcript_45274/g.92416 Transcript_45274/m.92416 type:complete len:113 (+) Transcript_45274:281-619(+)
MDHNWGKKLYDPSGKENIWYDLVDIKQIMGFLPLIPDYEHTFATIPFAAAIPYGGFASKATEKEKEVARKRRRERVFPLGNEDMATQGGTGSKTYYVNTLALSFGSRNGLML